MSSRMHLDLTSQLMKFIQSSPTSWHAVASAAQELEAAGAQRLEEKSLWKLEPDAFYYLRRGGSLLAFRIPGTLTHSGALNFKILAAHTDSPGLKLKPNGPQRNGNLLQWGVEVYGGALLNSWLDRDLEIAGRLCLTVEGKSLESLIRLPEAGLRIPQLAIHQDRSVNENGLKLNPQTQLNPIIGLTDLGDGALFNALMESCRKAKDPYGLKQSGLPDFKDPEVLQKAGAQWDLFLSPSEKPALGGLGQEFLYSKRIDNLAMCHAALTSICESQSGRYPIQVIALFDHEEVGSSSSVGAESDFLSTGLERILLSFGYTQEEYYATLARSFLISADMAHAIYPAWPERSEPNHHPFLGGGPVLKMNANGRYTSDAVTASRFQWLCKQVGIPCQNYFARNDMGCGSTIGPALASKLGVPSVDVGNPMLSMHSAREMCAAQDHERICRVFKEFFTADF